jgi:hypothetical protein
MVWGNRARGALYGLVRLDRCSGTKATVGGRRGGADVFAGYLVADGDGGARQARLGGVQPADADGQDPAEGGGMKCGLSNVVGVPAGRPYGKARILQPHANASHPRGSVISCRRSMRPTR